MTESDYTISVDRAIRSLVVSADPETHAVIRRILETLDEPAQLIAIDMKVTEVRAPRAFSLGFAFNIPLSSGDDSSEVIARLISTPLGGGLSGTPGPETTLFSRIDQNLNVPFTVDDGSGVAIPIANTGVIQAGDVEVRTEVLIEPSLIVTAGDTHEIFVGGNFPVPVQSADTGVGADGASAVDDPLTRRTTIERTDVGINLVVTAKASRVGPIQLDIEMELSRIAPSAAGDITLVGPTFVKQNFLVNARLKDGEAAIVAVNKDHRSMESDAGTPFLSDIPLLGWFFSSKGTREEDVHLIVAAQARRISTPAEFAADTIRRRLAFERRNAREDALPGVPDGESGFAVLVTTRGREDDAKAIAESLDLRGYHAEIHRWVLEGRELFDVYVTSLDSMADAADVASTLDAEGWQTNLTLLPTRS
jgi:type II secretory pathway component GspD/PulD (secretin)